MGCNTYILCVLQLIELICIVIKCKYSNLLCMETSKMTVQERIYELMKARNWTKYRLAKEIGVYPTTVYDWFNENQFTPSNESIDGICTIFGISRAQFYSSVDENQLDEEQIAVLELFAKIPLNKRKIVLDLMVVLSE